MVPDEKHDGLLIAASSLRISPGAGYGVGVRFDRGTRCDIVRGEQPHSAIESGRNAPSGRFVELETVESNRSNANVTGYNMSDSITSL
jgi:hypothetical protein